MVNGAFLEPGEITTCSSWCAIQEAMVSCANSFLGYCGIQKIYSMVKIQKDIEVEVFFSFPMRTFQQLVLEIKV